MTQPPPMTDRTETAAKTRSDAVREGKRAFWFNDAQTVLGRAEAYIASAQWMAEARDLPAMDSAIEGAVMQLRLARAARDNLRTLNAETESSATASRLVTA